MKFGIVMQIGPMRWIEGKILNFYKTTMAAAAILNNNNDRLTASDPGQPR